MPPREEAPRIQIALRFIVMHVTSRGRLLFWFKLRLVLLFNVLFIVMTNIFYGIVASNVTHIVICCLNVYLPKLDPRRTANRPLNLTAYGRILKRASRRNLDVMGTTIATYLHTCLSGYVTCKHNLGPVDCVCLPGDGEFTNHRSCVHT